MSTFIRTIQAKKKDETMNFIFQPYCVGMYCAVTGTKISGTMQLSFSNKEVKKEAQKIIKKMEKDGFVVELTERDYTDFLSEEEYKEYIEPDLKPKRSKV
jgi:hypothetical protein